MVNGKKFPCSSFSMFLQITEKRMLKIYFIISLVIAHRFADELKSSFFLLLFLENFIPCQFDGEMFFTN